MLGPHSPILQKIGQALSALPPQNTKRSAHLSPDPKARKAVTKTAPKSTGKSTGKTTAKRAPAKKTAPAAKTATPKAKAPAKPKPGKAAAPKTAAKSSAKTTAAKPKAAKPAAKAAAKPKAAKPKATPKAATKPAAAVLAREKAEAARLAASKKQVQAMLKSITACLDDDKAEDVVAIDLSGKTPMADYMVVASGRSSRHVGAIADHVMRRLKDEGYGLARVEGMTQGDWVLIDAGDIVIHVFRPEVREFYRLEKMWAADIPDDDAAA